jgi:uncharacterized protein (TIGR02001 family)
MSPVTATAALRRPVGRHGTSRALGGASLALAISCIFPAPAFAQWGASLGIESDYRLRGYSLTNGDPAATGQLTWDDPSGLYANLAGVARLTDESPEFMGVIGNIGYARRLSPLVTLDGGVVRSQIRGAGYSARPYHYTEFYAGASVGRVVGRVYYSPDYRDHGVSTLYGELEAGFEPAPEWRVSGHVGLLAYLDNRPYEAAGSTHRDWRVSVSRQFGRVEIHTALSGGGPADRYYYNHYYYSEHNKPALTVGASASF